MGFSRQEYWSGLPCPPPGDLPDPGIKPSSLMSPALAGKFFTPGASWEAPWPQTRCHSEQSDPGKLLAVGGERYAQSSYNSRKELLQISRSPCSISFPLLTSIRATSMFWILVPLPTGRFFILAFSPEAWAMPIDRPPSQGGLTLVTLWHLSSSSCHVRFWEAGRRIWTPALGSVLHSWLQMVPSAIMQEQPRSC